MNYSKIEAKVRAIAEKLGYEIDSTDQYEANLLNLFFEIDVDVESGIYEEDDITLCIWFEDGQFVSIRDSFEEHFEYYSDGELEEYSTVFQTEYPKLKLFIDELNKI